MPRSNHLRHPTYSQGVFLVVGILILGIGGCTSISLPKPYHPGDDAAGDSSDGVWLDSGASGSDVGRGETSGDGAGSNGDTMAATEGVKDGPSSGGGSGGAGGGGGGGGGAGPDAPVDVPALQPDAPNITRDTLAAVGAPCSASTECAAGNCVDGVCCAGPCSGCNACGVALTGKDDGVCAPVIGGKDPHGTCADETTTNQCGNDGWCDGAGACRKVSTSHVCVDASCTGSVFTPTSTCDGAGACKTVKSVDCAPSPCAKSGCVTTCAAQADCDKTTSYCDTVAKTCAAKKTNGSTASQTYECTSGFVADGVCCNQDNCTGCMACTKALNGQTDGQCRSVPQDQIAHAACTVSTDTCGATGMCDGAGACQYIAKGTACGSTCAGGSQTLKTCDGKGTCAAGTPTSCAPFACAGDTCGTRKTPGFTCSSTSECDSGFCADGRCCNRACTGSCEACDVAASPGTCTTLGSKATPHAGHPPCNGSDAPCAGQCDGTSGDCSYAPPTTPCGQASCTGNVYQAAGNCSTGVCAKPGTQTCNFACVVGSGCTGECPPNTRQCGPTGLPQLCSSAGSWQDQADCGSGKHCVDGSCASLVANGNPCQTSDQCASGNCSNLTCCAAGEAGCSGTCAVLSSSNGNCGSCGHSCTLGTSCSGGLCLLPDGQNCSTDGQCASGTCGTFYQDGDHDGYGAGTPTRKCGTTPPTNYVTNSSDCCDGDDKAHPGSTYVSATANLCGNWNYDCVGDPMGDKVYTGPIDGSCGTLVCVQSGGGCVLSGCTCGTASTGCPTNSNPPCGDPVNVNTQGCQVTGSGSCSPTYGSTPAGYSQACH